MKKANSDLITTRVYQVIVHKHFFRDVEQTCNTLPILQMGKLSSGNIIWLSLDFYEMPHTLFLLLMGRREG